MLLQHFSFLALAAMSFIGFAVTADAQFLPHRRMAKAAASDESVVSQARSQVIETEWKANLIATQGLKGLQLKTFVLMQRGFVVGFVDSQQQQNRNGLRGLSNNPLGHHNPVATEFNTGLRSRWIFKLVSRKVDSGTADKTCLKN
jgi:hypothetical protein